MPYSLVPYVMPRCILIMFIFILVHAVPWYSEILLLLNHSHHHQFHLDCSRGHLRPFLGSTSSISSHYSSLGIWVPVPGLHWLDQLQHFLGSSGPLHICTIRRFLCFLNFGTFPVCTPSAPVFVSLAESCKD